MKLDEFMVEMAKDLINFGQNMDSLEYNPDMSYADWFDRFRAWAEVGTYMERAYHGDRLLPRRVDEEPIDVFGELEEDNE